MRATGVGPLLQYWRKARQMSQLALATEADVSPRHVSFLETGRSQPSREMVLLLASALDVPLRERNSLLLAAGFAPVYSEGSLDAPELAIVRSAIDAILRQQEPFPAVVLDRRWNIVDLNQAATNFFGSLLGAASPPDANVLRLIFSPDGLRPHVANWNELAPALLARAQREAVGGVIDADLAALIDEVMAYPGVPARWRVVEPRAPQLPVIPVAFERGGQRLSFFSTVTTLGTPQDITAQEVRIECFFPADEATAQRMRER